MNRTALALDRLDRAPAARGSPPPGGKAGAHDHPLPPPRTPAGYPASPALDDARERIATHTVPAIERLLQLA